MARTKVKNTKAAKAKNTKNTKNAKTGAAPKRQQAADVAKLIVGPPRVKRWLAREFINGGISQQIDEFNEKHANILKNKKLKAIAKETTNEYNRLLKFRCTYPDGLAKEKRAAYEEKARAKHMKTIKAAMAADKKLAAYYKKWNLHEQRLKISQQATRFSKTSFFAVAAVLEEVIRSILYHAMDYVLSQNKKLIRDHHCITAGIEDTEYYCLFARTKTFIRTLEKYQNAQDDDEEESENEEEADKRPRFGYYVGNVGASIIKAKGKNKYSSIRLSQALRTFCSDICLDILEGLGNSLVLLLKNNGAKTINDELVKVAFSILLTFNNVDPAPLMAKIEAPIALLNKNKSGNDDDEEEESDEESDDDDEEEESDEESESEEPAPKKKGKKNRK